MIKKILHIISHLDIGGAEKIAYNIACSNNPDFEYHLVEVVKTDSGYSSQFEAEAREHGIIVHRSDATGNKNAILAFPKRFDRIMKDVSPDVIHTHTEIPDLSLFLYSFLHPKSLNKVSIVRTIHNNELWNQWHFIGKIVEAFYKRRAINVAISLSTQTSYTDNYHLKCPIIYNGIKEPEKKHFSNLKRGKTNILFAGRLEYQKGIPILAEVIKRLKCNNDLHFHIIGTGSQHEFLMSELNELSNFTYYPSIYGLGDFVGDFDFLFMPSLFEGLALMPIESSFAGTPPIINSCRGLDETLPPDWPLKVTNNDIDAYCNILTHLEDFDYAELQKSAKDYAEQNFTIGRMQTNYEQLYHNEINKCS